MPQQGGSVLGNAIGFFVQIGVYDVVLPFILVFTIVFAILEKTQIFGKEKVYSTEGKEYQFTRKNLNAMTAFVIAFFVIASARLVYIINNTLGNVVLLLVLIISFMLLVGAMYTGKDEFEVPKPWRNFFTVLVFIAIIFIFLNAAGVLGPWYSWLLANWDTNAVAAIGLLVVTILLMLYVTKSPAPPKKAEG